MNVGMLWFDADPKIDLASKIHQAAEFYRQKYGVQANKCFVNPAELVVGQAVQVAGISVIGDRIIMKHHLWIGREA